MSDRLYIRIPEWLKTEAIKKGLSLGLDLSKFIKHLILKECPSHIGLNRVTCTKRARDRRPTHS